MPDVHADGGQLGLTLYVTLAVANALLALVLFALWRAYRRAFLLHWGVAWSALALAHAAFAVASQLVHLPAAHAARLVVGALALTAGYAQVAGLVSGTWLLLSGGALWRTARVGLCVLPPALGFGSVFGTMALDPSVHGFTRGVLHGLLAGLAFLGSAYAVARVARREATLSRALVSGLFLLAGLIELGEALSFLGRLDGGFLDSMAALLIPRYLDLFLQLLLLPSLLLWFFEEERRERARTTRALAESEQRRVRAEHMEAVGRLAGGVAHDFNNLLTAISGHAELLLSRAAEGHADREDLEPIERAAGRAAELVRELLAFSRRQPLHPRHFVLDGLLGDMHMMLARLVGASVRLELQLGAPAAVLHADPAQIELAVINMASNARDAIAGSGRLTLRTSVVEVVAGNAPLAAGRNLLLEVSDDGCGIRAGELDKVFEPFYTTKPGKGTGLGLASVYGIVKQSGGEIRVESVPGQGTTFRIWLPLSAAQADRVVEVVPAALPPGGSETILLVEDESQVRLLAQRLLVRAGYRVVTAGSADEALECLRVGADGFQLLLSDVVMPGRSMREFLGELGRHHPHLRVALMSGYSEEALEQRGIGRASVQFLAKPFSARALLLAVRAALDAPVPRRVPSGSSS